MGQVINAREWRLLQAYRPEAKYYALADYVEYVRADRPYISRRIDSFLTLAIDIDTGQPAGFRIEGFRSFFFDHLQPRYNLLDDDFMAVVSVLELAATKVGLKTFPDKGIKSAYRAAYRIAIDDKVVLNEVPLAA